LRVSTGEQADRGAGLGAQTRAIEAEAERRDWDLLDLRVERGVSGKSMKNRPELAEALRLVESGEAEVLVVHSVSRLSRSLLDFAAVMEKAQKQHWNLVALDIGLDLSTPAGAFTASVMASAAVWERTVLSQRTREALAARRAQGVRLGRPRSVPDEVGARIVALRAEGKTWAAVAEVLNADGVRTGREGRQWWPSSARSSCMAYERDHV
jgi:DNA invertase Pin-like site-specific DNA recombinase